MATRICTQCGEAIPDNCNFCTNCGAPVPSAEEPQPQQAYNPQPDPQPQYQQPVQQQPVGVKPKNYLALSIIATILCCWPLGIPAIVYAAKVDGLWNRGDYAGAAEASRKAKAWSIASAVTGGVIVLLYVILIAAGVVAGLADL